MSGVVGVIGLLVLLAAAIGAGYWVEHRRRG